MSNVPSDVALPVPMFPTKEAAMGTFRRLFFTVRSSIFRRVHTNCLCNWCHLRPVKGTPEQVAALIANCPL